MRIGCVFFVAVVCVSCVVRSLCKAQLLVRPDRACRLAKAMWRTRPDPKEAQAKYEREYGANMRRRNSLFGTEDNIELARQSAGLADSSQAQRKQQAAPKKKWLDQVSPPLDTLRFIEYCTE